MTPDPVSHGHLRWWPAAVVSLLSVVRPVPVVGFSPNGREPEGLRCRSDQVRSTGTSR